MPLTWQGWPTLAAVRKHSPASLRAVHIRPCVMMAKAGVAGLQIPPSYYPPLCTTMIDKSAFTVCMHQSVCPRSQVVSQFGQLISRIVRSAVELSHISSNPTRAPPEAHRCGNCVTVWRVVTRCECPWKHALRRELSHVGSAHDGRRAHASVADRLHDDHIRRGHVLRDEAGHEAGRGAPSGAPVLLVPHLCAPDRPDSHADPPTHLADSAVGRCHAWSSTSLS